MTKILLVGAGAMGGGLHKGWLKSTPTPQVTIIDPSHPEYLPNLEALPLGYKPDVILLAVKPQVLPNVLPIYKQFVGSTTLFVSIAAGIPFKTYQTILGEQAQIIRAMPNLPATVGQGMTALFTNSQLSPTHRNLAESLFTSSGKALWIEDETLMDVVTAISGSGPAYFFRMVEALEKAGVAAGLAPEIAGQLARQTAVGAGAVLAESSDSATNLRIRVTSPGGTTADALSIFDRDDSLDRLVKNAVSAAVLRGQELSHA